MQRTPIKTGTQLIFPVLRIGDFFCVFLRYQIVINCVFSYFNWVITQIRSLIKVLGNYYHQGLIPCRKKGHVCLSFVINHRCASVRLNILDSVLDVFPPRFDCLFESMMFPSQFWPCFYYLSLPCLVRLNVLGSILDVFPPRFDFLFEPTIFPS